jgi:Family of unknown function (DUF5683)
MSMPKYFFIAGFLFLFQSFARSQNKDSVATTKKEAALPIKKDSAVAQKTDSIQMLSKTLKTMAKDTAYKKKNDPHKATLYSLILPGLGQVYNKKYWKLPLVYAAIGIPAITYFYNKSWYQKTQYALDVTINGSQGDSLAAVDPKLRPLVDAGATESLINYRNEFRKDQDYSVLFFLLFWGLQVVDATVDAHLKDFNVNNDLSFHIRPNFVPGPYATASLSFIFDIHKAKPRALNNIN